MSRRRMLTPEEAELWDRVARGTRRLVADPPLAVPVQPSTRNIPGKYAEPEGIPLGSAALNPTSDKGMVPLRPASASSLALRPTVAQAKTGVLRMDHRLHGRMVRGKLAPEARLDLHGMTLAQAHGALNGFILGAVRRGLRLVLVITGKGRGGSGQGFDHGPLPRQVGALRQEVPHWLRSAPLGAHVLNTHVAHRTHGGDGALYVYLRKAG